jgi:DNA-binding transcriptional regulator YiaG
MPKTRNFRLLEEQMLAQPGAREQVEQFRKETLAEIGLYELRRAQAVSQAVLAARLQITQPAISQLENADDLRVSTLREYVEALGGHLEITARFEDARVPIDLDAPVKRKARR